MTLATREEQIRKLISKYKQDVLKSQQLGEPPMKKSLAAGSVLIVEVDGEHWQYHEGMIDRHGFEAQSPSVCPCEAQTLREYVGV